jgi:hypothetical protein
MPPVTREQIEEALRRGNADAIEIARRLRPQFELPALDKGSLIY